MLKVSFVIIDILELAGSFKEIPVQNLSLVFYEILSIPIFPSFTKVLVSKVPHLLLLKLVGYSVFSLGPMSYASF